MKRGMGKIIQRIIPIGAAIAGHAWGNVGDGRPEQSIMPHFDRGGIIDTTPQKSTYYSGDPAMGMIRGWKPGDPIPYGYSPTGPGGGPIAISPQIIAAAQRSGVDPAQLQQLVVKGQGGEGVSPQESAQAQQQAINYGISADQYFTHHGGGGLSGYVNKGVNFAIPAITMAGIGGGIAGGLVGAAPNAAGGLTTGTGAGGTGSAGVAGLGTGTAGGTGLSMTPAATSAWESGFGGAGLGAGMASSMGAGNGLQAPAGWETTSTGLNSGGGLGLQATPSGAEAFSSGINVPSASAGFGAGYSPWSGGGFETGPWSNGGTGGNAGNGLRMPGATSGSTPSSSGFDLSPSPQSDFSSTNAGFNVDAGTTGNVGSPNPYESQYASPGQVQAGVDSAQTPPMQPQGKSIGERVMSGAQKSVANLPENLGAALPSMGVALGAQYLLGKKGAPGNDPGYQYAQQQAQTDAQRSAIALQSQKEFAANASKYGSDDYYRQMGDMQAMQFRSGRIAQRQQLQAQLQAQGRDPATVNALMQRFDNDTETGAGNAQNTGYLSARNAGLGPQQAAAGMTGSPYGAQTLSSINYNAQNLGRQKSQDISNIVGAPFRIGAQNAGSDSGNVANTAADAAAKASMGRAGLSAGGVGGIS